MPADRDQRTSFAKSERTRARILDSAASVFSALGYAGTRLADIADAAGIKQGSLYYYFDSKDALVEEMLRVGLERTYDMVSAAIEALGPDTSPSDRLRAAITAHAEAIIKELDYTAANARIVGQLPPESRRRHMIDQRPYGKLWDGLLTAARDAGEIRDDVDLLTLRLLLLGALNWTVEWPTRAKRTPAQVASALIISLFEGIATTEHV